MLTMQQTSHVKIRLCINVSADWPVPLCIFAYNKGMFSNDGVH